MKRRIGMTIIGILLTGISAGIFRKAALGVDPFNCLSQGIELLTGATATTVFAALMALFLVITFFLGRKYIGLGTLLSLFMIGILIDCTLGALNSLLPVMSLPARILLFAFGFVLMCFAASLYMTADLGVSSYDAMALIAHDRIKKSSFRICRITTDLICVTIGFLLHANIGIATVLTALCMGPLVQFFNHKIAQPLMEGKK